jgi:hypothetical protein
MRVSTCAGTVLSNDQPTEGAPMKKLILTATIGVTATALALTAIASGQDPAAGGTLTLTGRPRPADVKTVDVKPKGESVGDRLVQSETLYNGKAVAARVESDCVLVDPSYQGAQCTATLIFKDGLVIAQTVSVSKRIPGVDGTNEDFAILGGTGAHVGAAGTIAVRSSNGRDRVTIAFQP